MKKKILLLTLLTLSGIFGLKLVDAAEKLHFEIYRVTNEAELKEIAELRRGTDRQKYNSFLNELACGTDPEEHWGVSIAESGEFYYTRDEVEIQGKISERQEDPKGFPIAIEMTESYLSPITGEERKRVRLSTSTLLPIRGYSIVLSGMSNSVDQETG